MLAHGGLREGKPFGRTPETSRFQNGNEGTQLTYIKVSEHDQAPYPGMSHRFTP
ncbi:hypothetical protein GCM10010276_47710 [Streptomyces longisporus]|uniref:Uncharacterized protein n=1 Tax=Streptomyces longisporus TaxID=1948 RepID=A0ABN3MDE7_STRLO